jgi:aminoglycoside phosphotransferase (APT) family kinase protein
MSGPQAPAYTPTPAQLAAIAARHGLGSLTTWGPLAGGVVNPVLLLNEHAVLRINVRNAADPKIAKEAWVLDRLAGSPPPLGARVPGVLGADTSRTILPYDYLLLEYLPGRSAADAWTTGPAPTRTYLSQQMGAILARLHAQPLPGRAYGGWNAAWGGLGLEDDWRALTERRIARQLRDLEALDAVPAARLAAIRAWLTDHQAAVSPTPRRVLVHGDFGLWNMLVAPAFGPDGAAPPMISAVFDFEWSEAGPPALDFVPIFYDPTDPLDPAAVLDGYTGGPRLDQAFLQETHYYQMLYHLDLLAVVHRYWGGQGGAPHEAGVARLLHGEPVWGFAAAGYAWPF